MASSSMPRCCAPQRASLRGAPSGMGRTTSLRVLAAASGGPSGPNSGAFQSMQPGAGTVPLLRSEEARKYWRTVYDFPQWQKHRNQYRFVNRLLQLGQSHILANVGPVISSMMLWSATVAAYMTAHEAGMLPPSLPAVAPSPAASAFIQNTSFALSLLLVFHTNSRYGRWDEARKMWGGLLNRSRDIMRQASTCFPDDAVESKKALARWTVAFARALRIHFQPEVTLEAELSTILTPAELVALSKAQHKPVMAIHALSQIIQNVPMSAVHQQQMSGNLTFFHDVLGGCERLLRAPIPVSYTRHTARFLSLWLVLLPFTLYGSCGWGVVPVVGGITAVLCGIKEIGVQAEEPFGILPLDVICNRIQADVMATLQDDQDTRALLQQAWMTDLLASSGSDASASDSSDESLPGHLWADGNEDDASIEAPCVTGRAPALVAAALNGAGAYERN